MAKQLGRNLLVQADLSGTYTNICGLTARSFSLNNEIIDISTPDCTDPSGKLVFEGQFGLQRFQVEGTALYTDEAAHNAIIAAALAQTAMTFKVTVPGYGTFVGSSLIETVEFSGDKAGALEGKLKISMTGAITFTAA